MLSVMVLVRNVLIRLEVIFIFKPNSRRQFYQKFLVLGEIFEYLSTLNLKDIPRYCRSRKHFFLNISIVCYFREKISDKGV